MSFSFSLRVATAPRISALVDSLREPQWGCAEELPPDDLWPPGISFHPYVRGRSARGIEIGLEDGVFQVRILTCSSAADYDLALRTVRAIAQLTGADIEPEDGEGAMPLAAFDARYGPAWIEQMVAWGPDVIMRMVDTDGQTLTMSGAVREINVGPRFVSELRERKGDMTTEDHLLRAMVRLQWIDEAEWYTASSFRVTPKGKGEADAFTLAAWAPDVSYLFPAVEFFAIVASDGTDVLVKHEHGVLVAGDRWTWLDEKSALVDAVPQAEWDSFVAVARRYAVRMA